MVVRVLADTLFPLGGFVNLSQTKNFFPSAVLRNRRGPKSSRRAKAFFSPRGFRETYAAQTFRPGDVVKTVTVQIIFPLGDFVTRFVILTRGCGWPGIAGKKIS